MKVLNQYIIQTSFRLQILFECEDNKWYMSNNGDLGSMDFNIVEVGEEEAKEVLMQLKPKNI